MKVLGSGADCAMCGGQPSGRWQVGEHTIVWACDAGHAQVVKYELENGLKR